MENHNGNLLDEFNKELPSTYRFGAGPSIMEAEVEKEDLERFFLFNSYLRIIFESVYILAFLYSYVSIIILPDNQLNSEVDHNYDRFIRFTKTWFALAAVDLFYPFIMAEPRPEQTVELLTTKPSPVETEVDEGNFIEVFRCGNMETIKRYIDRKMLGLVLHVDDELDENGWTFLHLACRFNHAGIVEMLIEVYDANVYKKDKKGCTALHFASGHEAGNATIVGDLLLASAWCAVDPSQAGCRYINVKDNEGKTAIHTASIFGHRSVLKILLNEGKVDLSSKDNHGWTALHFASQYGHEEIVKMLLLHFSEKSISINECDKYGRTALDIANDCGNTDIVNILKESGAKASEKKEKGC